MQQDDPVLAAVIDLRQYMRQLVAHRKWYLPDGTLVIFSRPLTAAEVAEAYGIDNPEDIEVAA
jgi:hypothetical protein